MIEALRTGDPAPDFKLFNPFEVEVSLQGALEKSNVLVEFVRGTWDPNSRRRIDELSGAAGAFHERGARAIIISCEPLRDAKRFIEENSHSLTLLVDGGREIAKTYGVLKRFSYGAMNVALPASFVIDRCAFVRFASIGRSPIDTASLDDILRAIDAINAESQRGSVESS